MSDEVVIERRFRGPPESANGGYACGVVASRIEPAPAVEVTLRVPPPLEKPIAIEAVDGGAELRDGDTLIAEGRPVDSPDLELPDPVTLEQAEEARREETPDHPFPGCFVCGPERAAQDGLRVVCGPVAGRENELVASVLDADEAVPATGGIVDPEIVWAALDCPGGVAVMTLPQGTIGTCVLGRLTGQQLRPLETGASYIAVGWPIEVDGRKFFAGSAVVDQDGEPHAVARATWIEIEPVPS